jgi:hypothetical protein
MKSDNPFTWRVTVAVLSLCSLVGLFSLNAMAQTYVFNTAILGTGNNPQSVANADLNGDGRLDLIIANFNDSTVSVVLGNPDGSYQARVDYATGTNPIAVLVADFNNDKILDIAVVNNNCPIAPCAAVGSISILLGNGDGTFQGHVDTNVGNSPNSLAAADFNVDGNQDLIVTNGQDNTISILMGKGDGTFRSRVPRATGINPHGVAVNDFNNFIRDGKLDLVVANTDDSTMSFFRGNGDGTFQNPLTFATGPNPIAIVTADFNGDGLPDAATANSGSATVSVLFGKAPTGFQPHLELTVAGFPNGLVVGDFNGDGKPDLAGTAQGPDAVSILLGNGDTTFQPHVDYATGFDPVSVTVGDLNADGSADLAIANDLENTVIVLPGDGKGKFQSRADIVVGSMPSAVATGDFNNDLKSDMVVANRSDNNILLLLGNGDGTFTPAPGSPPQTGSKPSAVIAIDLNNDTKLDLVTTNSGDNTVSVLLGNGDGTFQSASSFAVGKRPAAVIADDFNGDGKKDLAVCNQNDLTVSILLGNGDGTFQAQRAFFTGALSSPVALADGDFGNGRLDLAIAASGTGNVAVLLGDGHGGFSSAAGYAAGTNPSGVVVDDFNGDGKLDLAVSNHGSNNVSILLGNGNGTFQPHVDYPTAQSPFSVVKTDFNGDGKSDLAVGASTFSTNRVSVLPGNGDGTFRTHVDHGTRMLQANTGEPVAVGDFNGDGSPDFVVADQLANSVSVFLNTPLPVLLPGSLDFGLLDIGVPSPPQTVTLFNSGTAPLSSLVPATTGDYSQTTSCGASLAMGENCSTDVIFTPANGGTRPGSLIFADNAPGGTQQALLTGVGNAPAVSLSVTSLTFGVTVVGTTSPKQRVTLTNFGAQTLVITSIVASNEFIQSNNCGTNLAPGASCVITVAFKPRNSGIRTGTVTITDNAIDSPQLISLTGTGTIVKLTPTNVGFGDQAVGTTSGPQTVTLTNVGKVTLNISDISLTGNNPGDFAIPPDSNTCGPTVAAGASCTFNVTFTPTQVGARKAAVSITDDGGGSPQTVPLSGNGV